MKARTLSIIPHDVPFAEAAALGCKFITAYCALVRQSALHD